MLPPCAHGSRARTKGTGTGREWGTRLTGWRGSDRTWSCTGQWVGGHSSSRHQLPPPSSLLLGFPGPRSHLQGHKAPELGVWLKPTSHRSPQVTFSCSHPSGLRGPAQGRACREAHGLTGGSLPSQPVTAEGSTGQGRARTDPTRPVLLLLARGAGGQHRAQPWMPLPP